MDNKRTYQYELLKKFAFKRFGGTEKELEAANILLNEIKSFGGEGEIMEFQIPAYDVHKCALSVTAPFTRDIPCIPHGFSGETPEGGLDLKLKYVEMNSPAAFAGLKDLSDTAVLVNPPLNFDFYKELIDRKAAAIIVIAMDKWFDNVGVENMRTLTLRDEYRSLGKIPTVTVTSKDALGIVGDGAEKVHIELRQTETTHTSYDVLATIEGTEITDESVVLTAHLDSVTVGTGAWDNGTGSVNLMYIYHHFLNNRPRRTMRFVWCGSEEQGLYGSKAYIEQHMDLIPSIICDFNFDMCGTIIGTNMVFITGGDDLKHIAQQICNEAGYPADFHCGVMSSDSAPFNVHGIPAVGLGRGTRSGEIHTIYDQIDLIGADALYKNGEFAIFFIDRFVNSVVFPVKRELSPETMKEVDKYFAKDKLDALKKEKEEKKD